MQTTGNSVGVCETKDGLPNTWFTFRRIFEEKRILGPGFRQMQMEISIWKANYLSFGGRITLIKETLSNLPTYYLSFFKIPKGFAADIERLQTNFYGGDNKIQNHTS